MKLYAEILILVLSTNCISVLLLSDRRSVELYSILSSIVCAVISVSLFIKFYNSAFRIYSFEFCKIPLQLEPINIIFMTMVSTLWIPTVLYSSGYLKGNPEINFKKYYFFLSFAILSTNLIAMSANLISTFIFYELLTICTYPLIANTGTHHEIHSARKYLSILLGSSMCILLPAILMLYYHTHTLDFVIGGITGQDLSVTMLCVVMVMFVYGVAKAAVVPIHSWLPAAMVAPIPVSAVLHAVAVVKSGIFILLKIYVYIYGLSFFQILPWRFLGANFLSLIFGASLIIAGIAALHQKTIKKLLAYSTISQLSICLLAMSVSTSLGIKAAILHMISHAVSKITLFFAAGHIYCNSMITEIEDLKGIGRKMRITAIIFAISGLSLLGIPPLAGFISKAFIFYASLHNTKNYFVLITLSISILITCHYMIKIIYYMFFCNFDTSARVVFAEEKTSPMMVAMFITTLLVIAYGLALEYILAILDRLIV